MLDYQLDQKRERTMEIFTYHFSHVLSWFLHFIVDFAKKFIIAMANAVKMLLHIR